MKRSRKRTLLTLAIVIGLLGVVTTYFLSSCCFPALHRPVAYDGDYNGRVVDEQTREPIQGVVVTAVWSYLCPTPAGQISRFYDAFETVTDERGDFTVPGKGLRLFVDLDTARLSIFKAGYEYFEYNWKTLKIGRILSKRIKWEEDRAIIPLRKLTEEERLKAMPPSRPNIPPSKMKLLTEQVNIIRIEKGARPIPIEDDK